MREEGDTYEKSRNINYKEDTAKVLSADRVRTSKKLKIQLSV